MIAGLCNMQTKLVSQRLLKHSWTELSQEERSELIRLMIYVERESRWGQWLDLGVTFFLCQIGLGVFYFLFYQVSNLLY